MIAAWKKRVFLIVAVALSSICATRWLQARVTNAWGERALHGVRGLYETALLTRLVLPNADSIETMTLNGAGIRLATVHSSRDEFDSNSILEKARLDCSTPHANPRDHGEPLLDPPLLLSKNDVEGALFCFKPREPLDAAGLGRTWKHVLETGDFSESGTFHAVYTRSEGRSVTTFTVEILEGFRPTAMFPETGDAPGADIQQLPRPPGRRILSLSHRGSVALTGYRTTKSALEALAEYSSHLEETPAQVKRPPNLSDAVFVRTSGESFVVTTQAMGEGSALFLARLPE